MSCVGLKKIPNLDTSFSNELNILKPNKKGILTQIRKEIKSDTQKVQEQNGNYEK